MSRLADSLLRDGGLEPSLAREEAGQGLAKGSSVVALTWSLAFPLGTNLILVLALVRSVKSSLGVGRRRREYRAGESEEQECPVCLVCVVTSLSPQATAAREGEPKARLGRGWAFLGAVANLARFSCPVCLCLHQRDSRGPGGLLGVGRQGYRWFTSA